jgi:ABC-type transport system substrate-binding protein
MKRKSPFLLFVVSLLLILSMVLASCTAGGQETVQPTEEAPAEEPTEEPAEEPTEAPAEEPTEEPAEEPTEAAEEPTEEATAEATEEPAEEPTEEAGEEPAEGMMSLAAENCDYGGKISSIEATDPLTVVFNLCSPDPAFLAKVAFTPFGIQPSEWLEETGGTGELLEHPIGTGPYMIEEWVRGDSITFRRFEDYWGEPAFAETAVLRWNQEGAARLVELQSGNVDVITNVSPDDEEAVANDPNLQLIQIANPNVFYVGFTNTFAPFDNVEVRRAIAMGIDRQRIVDNFYPPGSEVPSHFTPCSIANGCEGEPWYEFDPEAARAALEEAGFPFDTTVPIYYRDVFRGYLPEPSLVAVEIQTQLQENLGITSEVVVMESGEFIEEALSGRLDGIHLLGWGADYPHVTNFLDYHFGEQNTQFGNSYPEIYEHLQEAGSVSDPEEAAPIYTEANNAIREVVPMVPIANGASSHAALASVEGFYYPPFGAAEFSKLNPGKDTLVYMQNAEPIGLYCADESDGESLRPCQQVVETLYEYAVDSGETVPELATSCESSEDGMVWTCTLREGVLFHDGSEFDANDVVASWAVGLDAANPLHVGNSGIFTYYANLWGLMNPPPAEE